MDDCIKFLVPAKFCLRWRRSNWQQSKAICSSVQRVFASETNLEDLPSVDNFYHSRLYLVDKCANAHIWNTKEDFEAGSLKSINRLSKVATIGGNKLYPESVGRLSVT